MTNGVDPDELQDETSYLDLHCLHMHWVLSAERP